MHRKKDKNNVNIPQIKGNASVNFQLKNWVRNTTAQL